jgi:hypothetical protein
LSSIDFFLSELEPHLAKGCNARNWMPKLIPPLPHQTMLWCNSSAKPTLDKIHIHHHQKIKAYAQHSLIINHGQQHTPHTITATKELELEESSLDSLCSDKLLWLGRPPG